MGDDAVQERQRQRHEKADKDRQDAEKQVEQEDKEREDQDRRQKIIDDPEHQFSGSLKSKKKAELQDIAFTLGLPLKATNEKLASSIRERLLGSSQYRAHRRYKKLFTALETRHSGIIPPHNSYPGPSTGGCPAPAPRATSPESPVIDPALATLSESDKSRHSSPDEQENIPLSSPANYPPPPWAMSPHTLPRSPLQTAEHRNPYLNVSFPPPSLAVPHSAAGDAPRPSRQW
ncbi:hypothetical protein K466DRAFT_590621 [Polyporus arcularius HHB13444]|uniref:Uncharacterized protein n=1 Tax=Polyporus arcularius HHB13444 TaxID=1314778 RepID=A0A5C3NZW2_9APHY|nr:hypothetical protein K466DRAFT_590621 [Polyporus arcularius HHB13444]